MDLENEVDHGFDLIFDDIYKPNGHEIMMVKSKIDDANVTNVKKFSICCSKFLLSKLIYQFYVIVNFHN